MKQTYGYVRVSSTDQNEARQVAALVEAGVAKEMIFIDRRSGKDFKRPAWKSLSRRLKQGDVLKIQSIDRLGRNYSEILNEWRRLVKSKGVNIYVLDMPILNTQSAVEGVTGVFIADMVLQILSYVAEIERENIRERQRQGIAAAKSRGVKFGRKKIVLPAEFGHHVLRVHQKEISQKEAAGLCGLSLSTFRRRMKEWVYQGHAPALTT